MLPPIQYADAGGLSIAYQVFGDGPRDLIYVPGLISHLELEHEWPGFTAWVDRLARFARVIIFDKRGQGLSDRMEGAPTLDERMDDITMVMDAVGIERAHLLGVSEGGTLCALFAATYPERVQTLSMFGSFARFSSSDDYPHMLDEKTHMIGAERWGKGWTAKVFSPSIYKEPGIQELAARFERATASPSAFKRMVESNLRIDVRGVLSEVKTPTLVVQRRGDEAVSVGNGRFLADHIAQAKYVELPGVDHLPSVGDFEPIAEAIEEFVTGTVHTNEPADRALATVLFTDIVDSSRQLSAVGDKAWKQTLDQHDRLALNAIEEYRGRLIKSTGDGILATFDGPTRGVQCAQAFAEAVKSLSIEIRAGLHIGEVEWRQGDVSGLTVHIAARVAELAIANQVLVTRTLTDLIAGSDVRFAEHGEHELKGIPNSWPLFAVA